jgi:hypothetical protein
LQKQNNVPISVAKLAIELIMPFTIAQPSSLPEAVPGWETIGPIPLARTILQMKKAMPAVGTTKDLTVKRCLIVCT